MRRRRDQRGAAMVEMAIILPLILLLTFGLIDFGFAFADAAGIKSAGRSGARIGSALSKQPGQLQSIVAAVNAGLGNSTRAQATELFVYTASPSGFSAPSTCAAGVTNTSASLCYDQVIPQSATDKFTLSQTDADRWDSLVHLEDACPAVGSTVTAWKLDVTVKAVYPFLSARMFGTSINLHETVVIDLEPTSTGTCASTP